MAEFVHEEAVRQVRVIGEYLIKNAESIVGTEDGLKGIDISGFICPFAAPGLQINKKLSPENDKDWEDLK